MTLAPYLPIVARPLSLQPFRPGPRRHRCLHRHARRLKKTSSRKAIGRFFSHVLHAGNGCALWFPHAFDPIVIP